MPDKKTAIYPGSFNPIHPGHMSVITQAGKVFDQLVILVADNPGKSNQVSPVKRVNLIKQFLGENMYGLPEDNRITVEYTSDSLADYCSKNDVGFIVRGLRNGDDLEYEKVQKYFVSHMATLPIVYTFFTVPASYEMLSSSALRQCAAISTPLQFHLAYWGTGEVLCEDLAKKIHKIYRKKK